LEWDLSGEFLMGKCVVCGKETIKVLFKDAIEKTYICSMQCLKEYFRPAKDWKLITQKKLTEEDEGWLD